ncbi:type II toxin-antitoxin system VapB family antitoxin [Dyadobacter flavalbus]|nr:DUF2281 domain-containing protein [Dyadobacter flavalbus]
MSETELINRVSILPENLQVKVSDYVDFLIGKYLNKKSSGKTLQFGMMKGTFEMKSDFDEPLDDFKEYMP